MTSNPETRSAVPRPVTVSVLPTKGFELVIDASEKERALLAEAHGLVDVPRFHADLEIKRWRKDGARISGRIAAQVVQNCIVTLEPLTTDMDVPVEAVFLPEGSKLNRPLDDEGALLIDPEGPDTPETFAGGVVDVGQVAEEFFELAIDHYPRAPGAELPETPDETGDGEDSPDKPFSALSALRDKL